MTRTRALRFDPVGRANSPVVANETLARIRGDVAQLSRKQTRAVAREVERIGVRYAFAVVLANDARARIVAKSALRIVSNDADGTQIDVVVIDCKTRNAATKTCPANTLGQAHRRRHSSDVQKSRTKIIESTVSTGRHVGERNSLVDDESTSLKIMTSKKEKY